MLPGTANREPRESTLMCSKSSPKRSSDDAGKGPPGQPATPISARPQAVKVNTARITNCGGLIWRHSGPRGLGETPRFDFQRPAFLALQAYAFSPSIRRFRGSMRFQNLLCLGRPRGVLQPPYWSEPVVPVLTQRSIV